MEYEKIIQLINDFGNSKLDNLKLDFPDGTKIDMSKNSMNCQISEKSIETRTVGNAFESAFESAQEIKEEKITEKNDEVKGKLVTSPMVGTFYLKPSPNAEPYVEIGKKVKKGDVLCIIEAMKLMNEIESEYDGIVEEIFVNDAESVEYGKPLFRIL